MKLYNGRWLLTVIALFIVLITAACAIDGYPGLNYQQQGGGRWVIGGTFDIKAVNAAGGSANPFDFTGTLGIMDNNDTFQLFDINLTNANHTGSSNVVEIFNIANITGDAQATETAINIGTGWDAGITSGSLVNFNAGLAMDTNAFAVADTTGVVTFKGGATADNNADAAILNLTETTVRVTGALDVTGGLTTDTNALAIADTTGVVTMKSGATIDNNADAAVLNLTETTVRVTGILDVTGNSTLASLDVGGGSGGSGATITAAGAGTFDAALTADSAVIGGGYGSSGATISNAGAVSLDGTLTTAGTTVTTLGNGAIVADKCTVVEGGVHPIHQTVVTFTLTGAHDLDLPDGDHGTGVKIYDMPAGRILILGATVNGLVTTTANYNASTNDIFYLSMGTAVGADDNDLTDTEADIIPKSTLDTTGGTTITDMDWHNALAASAQFDGATSSAVDIYVNAAIAGTTNTDANTYAITGTATISWINLGDF